MAKDKNNSKIKKLTDFLLEYRSLKHIRRGGLQYLRGAVNENAAEHTLYTVIIAWILAKMEKANEEKAMKMALVYNLAEIRSGEKNLINTFYSQPKNESKIIEEINKDYNLSIFGLVKIFKEFSGKKNKEARVVKDADIISGMLLEKEALDYGSQKVKKWLTISLNRLKTKSGKELGKSLITADADDWWLKIAEKYIMITKFI